MQKRVVITGIGGICGLGTNASAIWSEMRAGRSAIGPIDNPLLHDLKVKVGCEIKALPDHGIDRKQLVSMDRFSLLATIAAREAAQQAGLTSHAANTYRMGTIVGVGVCGWEAIEENYRAILIDKRNRAGIFTVPKVMPGAAAGHVSMNLGLRGPVFGVTSACSSSNHAIASAVDQIRLGRADVMVAGGTDAPLVWGILKGWEALRVLSPDTCRPFSADRQGLVLGEGAGMVVLETYEHAMARGATILAEVAGAGLSGDASDIVAPTIEGPEAAMRFCLVDAQLNPEDVDYLNAHGTGTKANDQIETAAIKRVFGDHAYKLSISSTKSMHAHCLGASGGLELIACVMAIREGIVPPTANFREADADCDLDITPNVARERKVRVALSNGFAFGGTNAVLAFKAV
ncbi:MULTISPECIES: beta-ketoacyl-[acyl-carrier-protein] synthase family protein [unclassified Mesorhizobium]|uniref:beta-ketoacyl-[acyl-carrier-protein] synthase family protein n=1 Tax=unclassified Mesorhizobium TaxID=325217 RepID=UPI000FD9165E|nr:MULTISPECIES: beta-ketoacyl-[acyl-carrier-protein] synthase family protein [unclassified Mesorhizobium]TGQ38561.1 beta-ketoacyl-[acyl-carrier-protein] synthase family protein [Mesorhizobium sp. M00.F.Ca.ET.216.01.1.1]TIS60209.1 MAG: beta-ketoacyl-ACP synthase II [Mesorhizobium sp.]TJW04629.1 MAG: beta-ketoacyl-ACP synthase II [Mesorhizobium sp.]